MTKLVNGVDLDPIEQLVSAISLDNRLANMRFVAKSVWKGGTQSEVCVSAFYADGLNVAPPERKFTILVDEPAALGGKDAAPNPIEYLAAALCGCITAGVATNTALFGTTLDNIEVAVDADINLLGILGLDRNMKTSCNKIGYKVSLSGPGDADALLKAKEVIDRKSPVRWTFEKEVPISTSVEIIE